MLLKEKPRASLSSIALMGVGVCLVALSFLAGFRVKPDVMLGLQLVWALVIAVHALRLQVNKIAILFPVALVALEAWLFMRGVGRGRSYLALWGLGANVGVSLLMSFLTRGRRLEKLSGALFPFLVTASVGLMMSPPSVLAARMALFCICVFWVAYAYLKWHPIEQIKGDF